MKIRVIHKDGSVTTLNNVEKLYLLDGVSTIDRLHENHIDPSLAEVFFEKKGGDADD